MASSDNRNPRPKKSFAAVLLFLVFVIAALGAVFYMMPRPERPVSEGPECIREKSPVGAAPADAGLSTGKADAIRTEEKQTPSEEKQPPTEEKQAPTEAQAVRSDTPYVPVSARPARFLTDVCLTRSGDIWVTAEAGGVFRLRDPEKDREWEDMRALPGFPATNNCTAVCEDSQGRIWVGTASMGVQVFCGGKWQRYDRDTVLSGSHVHDLASSETGLTAVAHECGVSVYDSRDGSWRDYTVLNGLPAGGVRGVCFEPGGRLHCAMESGGYVQLDLGGNVRRARHVTAPDSWGRERAAFYPLTAEGDGMSSNFCNGIAVDGSGQVCIAGLNGISYGKDRRFRFLQGLDLNGKIENAYRKELIDEELKAGKKKSGSGGRVVYDGEEDFEDEEEEEEELIVSYDGDEYTDYGPLKESYVTCVHYGKNGLWIGYRTKGVELRRPDDPRQAIRGIEWQDPENPQITEIVYHMPDIRQPVRGFAELPDGRVFVATYGAGLVKLCRGKAFELPPSVPEIAAEHPSYKGADPVSVLQDFQRYDLLPDDRPETWAQYLGEDWVTKGDWCGRYGARRQLLCAMNTRLSTRGGWNGGVTNEPITLNGGIGPHKFRSDSMRNWIDWEEADNNRDVLLQMEYGHRTQSEWNDNGEEYPRTFEGPDLWLMFILAPEEIYRLSLYFFNSNGRIGENVERDYIIEIYESKSSEDIRDCMKKTPLCTARVADFASGGVYKSFALHGGGGTQTLMNGGACFRVRLVRYGSLNVILNGIFLDRLFEPQDVREMPEEERIAEQGNYRAPRWYDCGTDTLDGTAKVFYDWYFAAPDTSYGLASMPLLRLAFYRYVRDNLKTNEKLAERLRWDACIWTDADRAQFDAAMKEYWTEILKQHPERAERK